MDPFRVLSNGVRTFLIKRDDLIEQIFVDRVAYAPSSPQPVPPSVPPAGLAAKMRTGPTYIVDKLPDYRVTDDDTTEFLVKLSAHGTLTWKPCSHIPEQLGACYFTRGCRRTGRHVLCHAGAETSP